MYTANTNQIAFRESLPTDALKANYDLIIGFANTSADVAAFVKQLPETYAPLVQGIVTLEAAVDKVIEVSNWKNGDVEITYKAAAKIVAPKKTASKKAIAAPPVAGATEAPAKRRGNPEALKKAREARGIKSPEMVAKDRATVIAATVDYLKKSTTAEVKVIHIKAICKDLTAAMVGKGSDGKDLKEVFIYQVITETAKDVATTPFIKVEMEGHKCGYSVKA